ncbi:MAG: hypothetical protein O7C75_02085 [Verrucomicrobia bacterium]|nr:hypothetical protein [Verrucomicrobiota bacterium]
MTEACPYLPEPDPTMDWRSMNTSKGKKGTHFYMTALQYAQVLWLRQLPARAVLAVNRALLTELVGDEPELKKWPLPYRAMAWMLENYKDESFVGNPRVHFQHLATRVKGGRTEQRRWRAWACWYLSRQTRPYLPGDEKQGITGPKREDIRSGLRTFGIPDELVTWEAVVQERELV